MRWMSDEEPLGSGGSSVPGRDVTRPARFGALKESKYRSQNDSRTVQSNRHVKALWCSVLEAELGEGMGHRPSVFAC